MASFDDEEGECLDAGTYPIMPSLVGLQQMKNRLHLAQLGKKMMKWTALATGRELRRIACEINVTYDGFSEDISEGYIALARCRYFEQNFSGTVLEGVPVMPNLTVASSVKTFSGVRVLQYSIVDDEEDPYPHLGIGRGGQAATYAKTIWKQLLLRMIAILELRESFTSLEVAYKSAAKRKNVLSKMIIPRIRNTIKYILLQLEELDREELYRIKKIKQKKEAKRLKNKERKVIEVAPAPDVSNVVIVQEKPCSAVRIVEELFPKSASRISEMSSKTKHLRIVAPETPQEEQLIPSMSNIDFLKLKLMEVLEKSRSFMEQSLSTVDMNEFLLGCEEVRSRITHLFTDAEKSSAKEVDKDIYDHLQDKMREVLNAADKYRHTTIQPSTSIDDIVKACRIAEHNLGLYLSNKKGLKTTTTRKWPSRRLKDFSHCLSNVEKLASEYKEQGIASSSMDNFLLSCKNMERKIEALTGTSPANSRYNIEHSQDPDDDIRDMTTRSKVDDLASKSIDTFLNACRDFKAKIQQKISNSPIEVGDIKKLKKQLDEAITLSKEAKKGGITSASFENFIKSCENAMKNLEEDEKLVMESETDEPPMVLSKLRADIDAVMNLVAILKDEGLITASIAEIVKNCETTKTGRDLYEKVPINVTESEGCMIFTDEPTSDQANKWGKYTNRVSPPYVTRGDTKKHEDTTVTSEIPCNTCKEAADKSDAPICRKCGKDIANTDVENTELDEYDNNRENLSIKSGQSNQSDFDSKTDSIGYYERRVRTLIKLMRTRDPDGTIKEEKQTVTIRQEKHDPNKLTIAEDSDDDTVRNESYDSLLSRGSQGSRGSRGSGKTKRGNRRVGYCTLSDFNQIGFLSTRTTKSETLTRVTALAEPILRQCLSLGANTLGKQAYITGKSKEIESDSWEFSIECSFSDKTLYS